MTFTGRDPALVAFVAFFVIGPVSPVAADGKKLPCMNGQAECHRLSNGTVEVLVTTSVGPRVAFYGFRGGPNTLKEVAPPAGFDRATWQVWGGHRLWHAPENRPRTYVPDNAPVEHRMEKGALHLSQNPEPETGIAKEMILALDSRGTRLSIRHRLTNRGPWPIEVSAWAMTVMASGGTGILPQEPFVPHNEEVLPARPLALWAYTDLADPRYQHGKRFLRIVNRPDLDSPQKIGIGNRRGWAAYAKDDWLFVKRFLPLGSEVYPDFGANNEVFTRGDFFELETLGPLRRLAPGATTEHVEVWYLFGKVALTGDEASWDKVVAPLVAKTTPVR
jgi:hypothetical protein